MPSFQIFTSDQIASFRRGGEILRGCLDCVAGMAASGVSTRELDRRAEEYIRSHAGAVPGFKGYHGFPATLCTSVNEETVHGIPGDRRLREGDIISLDCGVLYDGLYTDACVTVAVGAVSPLARGLLVVTEKALRNALGVLRAGARVGDVSAAVERTVRAEGFAPVRALTGHGLGTDLHQFPDIPNFGKAGTGAAFPAHTVVAIEPIISAGSDAIEETGDGWTIRVKDRALTAHFEHTVLVTAEGCEILA